MKMNVPIDEATDADRAIANQTFGSGDLPNAPEAAISHRNSFPLRTLVVCFTIWLIATEVLIFDQIKFNVRTELLEQATRAIRVPQLSVPTERPSNLPGAAKMESL
jgi:hypothetical protein